LKFVKGFNLGKSVLSRHVDLAEGHDEQAASVRQIVDEVRKRGDAALFDYTLKFDGVKLTALQVSKEQIAAAYQQASDEVVAAIKTAAERIQSYHATQDRKSVV
jgi:histidinol dehydrogenase